MFERAVEFAKPEIEGKAGNKSDWRRAAVLLGSVDSNLPRLKAMAILWMPGCPVDAAGSVFA
jgi:hypothetical protein